MSNLTKRENRLCAIICNVMIVALEAMGALISTLNNGWSQFQFYTQNSNYIAMIISILFLIAAFRVGLNKSLPNWIVLLRYIATCLLSVTFLVIVFLLCPPTDRRDTESLC
ncbi:MAG: hypothetical protein E7680_03435 [Ruminococcaceae bacterium]|nr:hypothetical protein [Oscillospiraceae bacterium]